ncbi:NAD(P)-dependent oxidoreductase [Palleronia sp. LCG004]|uniref:NAD(P)-dependent oxidoreductase n=1 Tax=Palleronia sp. LCG004 TaxID=3079304 RepID=UPI002943DAC6|nr:NAD(P)-dependent oxidoreductase [Palleronia sp. LCG004]WOI57672.1 NAD(P)-dependent oxidoreductase [Palleronia sp. LCG004]
MGMKIAVIGCGAMGGAIAARLCEAGQNVRVFDLDEGAMQALVAKGATATRNAAEAASGVEYVIISLNGAEIVERAVFGEDGVASGAGANVLLIDMSSIDPEATKALATRAGEAGLRWVDSPLSGGAPKVATGDLALMCGGSEDDVDDAANVLSHLAANITRMGDHGAGQATKLINQVLCGLHFMAAAEATQLAVNAGVDASKIPGALRGGRADSAILQEYMPRFVAKDYRRTGRIDNMVKDLDAAQALARRTNTSMPLTALCNEIHRMLTSAGLGCEDQAALMEYFEGPDLTRFD